MTQKLFCKKGENTQEEFTIRDIQFPITHRQLVA
jgi:hypothetical protein